MSAAYATAAYATATYAAATNAIDSSSEKRMMTVTIKTLVGDLLEIQHELSDGFDQFIDNVYEALPHLPYGCLVLRRGETDDIRSVFNGVLDELLHVYTRWFEPDYRHNHNYKAKVTRVMDGDYFYAMVDHTLVQPRISQGKKRRLICEDGTLLALHTFYIDIYSTVDYNPYLDDYVYICGNLTVYFDKKHHLFALADTFEEENDIELSPTDRTKWFLSVVECLESMEDQRFPRNEEILFSIRRQIDRALLG